MRVKKKWSPNAGRQISEDGVSGGGLGSVAHERDVFEEQIREFSGAAREKAGVNRGGT